MSHIEDLEVRVTKLERLATEDLARIAKLEVVYKDDNIEFGALVDRIKQLEASLMALAAKSKQPAYRFTTHRAGSQKYEMPEGSWPYCYTCKRYHRPCETHN